MKATWFTNEEKEQLGMVATSDTDEMYYWDLEDGSYCVVIYIDVQQALSLCEFILEETEEAE